MIDKTAIEQARNTDIISFLEQHKGFTFKQRGGGEYRCVQHDSLSVKHDRISWYWHSKSKGGRGVLNYLTNIEYMPFQEAFDMTIGLCSINLPQLQEKTEQPKILILPEKASVPLRLYNYLCVKRGIDNEIVTSLMHEGKIYEDKRKNIIFVGFDEHGKARFACLRGTQGEGKFRRDCSGSDKRYGFCITSPQSERLYIFESAIDLMSHASVENFITGNNNAWKNDNRLTLGGTSDTAIPFFLNQHSFVKELVFCLDNDPAGRDAAVKMAREYADKGFYTRLELPTHKDCNEDLINLRREQMRKKQPETHCKSTGEAR